MSLAEVAVVILAAGSGRRLGLGPKAHVTLAGETFLATIVRRCRDAGLGAVFVVGSAEDALIEAACHRVGARLVVNVDPSRGMSSSVHAGLEAVSIARVRAAASVVVYPVDLPLVRTGTVALVAGASVSRPDAWARPCVDGSTGHPIALGARLLPRVLEAGPTAPLRDVLRAIDAPCVDVVCDDRGVLVDIDDPGALAAARAL